MRPDLELKRLLDPLFANRVYAVVQPQGTAYPSLIYAQTGGDVPEGSFEGTYQASWNYRLEIKSRTYEEAVDLEGKLLSALAPVLVGWTPGADSFENDQKIFQRDLFVEVRT